MFLLLLATAGSPVRADAPARQFPLSAADRLLLDEIERTGFRFFAEQSDPHTGLVRDRARADGSASEGKASIAASGFALSTWAIAVDRGWVERSVAVARVRESLRFLVEKAPREHGFFYHFMEMDTGARAWQCELSSIDSSLLYSGVIVAREYFADPEITALANRLLDDVDWGWFRNGGGVVAMGWHPETGFSRFRWRDFSEQVLLSYLALGVSSRPLEAGYWQSWSRRPVGRYRNYVYLQEGPLFECQYPLAYLDLRDRRDATADYFHNARLSTLAQRQFCIDLQSEFPSWGPNLWGLTASDSATGYKAWGGPPRSVGSNALDGTIVPCAAAGSLPFAPRETLAVLHHLRIYYGDRIWKRYGFVDAFNPENGWVNPDVLGIDVGISVLQAENLRSGLVWRMFMQSPEARLALGKSGLLSRDRHLEPAQTAHVLDRAAAAWRLIQVRPAAPGLQLTALIAAQQLGWVTGEQLLAQARAQLAAAVTLADGADAAEYGAALVTLRQAVPALAAPATEALERIDWAHGDTSGGDLGTRARLAVFFQVATGARPPAAWSGLARSTQVIGPVRVLAPADVSGALVPGLWLNERSILPGASAAQLAYASLVSPGAVTDPLLTDLQLDQFPRATLATPLAPPTAPDAAAVAVITAANLLVHDAIREAFQRDPLVRTGWSRIAEFGEAAFGRNTSIIAQRELAMGPPPAAPRVARAVANSRPRTDWDWQTVAGSEFQDSEADVRPDDAPLVLRFAFTWDETALHFQAEVTDTPAGFHPPPARHRSVELFLAADGQGLTWAGTKDYQFIFPVDAAAGEIFHQTPIQARITPTEHGYMVEAAIPWTRLGVAPRPGVEIGASPAVVTEGVHDAEAMLKLNWSFVPQSSGASRLGRITLQ
ncbi:MAG: glucoamylase family protein [Opitutales bacterium]